MSMFNTGDILETIEMFTQDNLDVRTVTMGISLLDCIDPDPKKACENIYNKITTKAANLVSTVEHISAEYGIPIINKRISVTPIAMLLGACPEADPVDFAKTLDAAGKKVGVNFVGGYSALVHKGFSAGDRRLIESIPRALAETDIVCSSVNIGATKAGLNMDAIKLMGEAVKKASELTADRQCIGAYKSHAVEPFHNGAESAGIIEINKEMLTGGIELHDMRHAVAYLIHAVKLKSQPCFVRDSGQMQHCVRRTSERHIADKRIFYRLVGDNAARTEVTLDELHYPHAGTLRKSNPVGIDGGDSPVSCQGKTEYFRHAVHGVCGEHAGA